MSRLLPTLVALLPVFALACADPDVEDAGSDAGPANDSGPAPDLGTPDAGPIPDGGFPDLGTIDSGTPDTGFDAGFDAGPLPVTVRFDDLRDDEIVVFHDPSGAVLETVTTSAGLARSFVPAGGMVTIHTLYDTGKGDIDVLSTITGVEPGDVYRVPLDRNRNNFEYVGDLEVTPPGDYPNNEYYELNTGCGELSASATGVRTDALYADCLSPAGDTAVLMTCYDANDVLLAFSAADPVTLTSTVTPTAVTLPAWDISVLPFDVTVSNAPAGTSELDVYRSVLRAGRAYARLGNYITFNGNTGGTVAMQAPTFGDGSQTRLSMYVDGGESLWLSRSPTPAPITMDLGLTMLPVVSTASVVLTSDANRPDVRWTPTGISGDGAIVQIQINNPYVLWNLVIPIGATRVGLPELPPELAEFRPDAQSNYYVGYAAADADFAPDYRAFRQSVAVGLIQPEQRAEDLLPPSSVLRISLYQFNFR